MAAQAGNAAAHGVAEVGASLYVNGLHEDVTASQLYDVFNQIGEVVSVEVCQNSSIGLPLQYGYIHYRNPQCAQRALEELNFTPINGKHIRIILCHQAPSTSNSGAGIACLENSENGIDHRVLPEKFLSFENTESCSQDASGQSMGYGYESYNGQLSEDKAKFTNLFVKNFCESTTEDALKYIFGQFGWITNAVIMRNDDGTSKCFGFVNFKYSDDAARAAECLNRQIIDNKKWYVGRAKSKHERQQELVQRKYHLECVKKAFDNGSNIYVKNLDSSIDDEKLKELFSPFGSVTSCGVLTDEKGISTERGYVAFSSAEEASDALSGMNGTVLLDKTLSIVIARRKEDRRTTLQNLEKKIDHYALPDTFSSSEDILSCEVAKDASGDSNGRGFVQFADEVTGQESIGELGSIIGKFNVVIRKLNGNIEELKGIVGELKGLLLNRKKVSTEGSLTKEIELLREKANLSIACVKNYRESATPGEDVATPVESLNSRRWYSEKAQLEREQVLNDGYQQLVKETIDKPSNLYFKNLHVSINDEKLKELFSFYGLVTSCKIFKDRKGRSKGSGFIAFSSPEEASRALSEMNGKILFDKPLYVELAQRTEDTKSCLQNLDNEIDHKAPSEPFLSSVNTGSCKVATDASDQSLGFRSVHSGMESLREATGEHNGKQVHAGSSHNEKERRLSLDKPHFTNVFLKSFCESTTEDDLRKVFGEFGTVTNAAIMRNKNAPLKCFGYVNFGDAEDAARAVGFLNGRIFNNKSWYVALARKSFKREPRLNYQSHSCVNEEVDKGSNPKRHSIPHGKLSEVFSPSRSQSCVNEEVDKGSNHKKHSIPHGKLSEVFSPSRSLKSCEVMQDQKEKDRKSGFVAFSPPKQASKSGQPGYGYEKLLVPGLQHARPLMHIMSVPLIQNQQQDLHSGGRHTNADQTQKDLLPALATKQQMLPRGRQDYHCPSKGMFSLRDVVISRPIPVTALASSLANASSLNKGRCWMKCCSLILSSCGLNI